MQDSQKSRTSRLSPDGMTVPGMVPPQAADIEEAVLGAILDQEDVLLMVSDILTPDIFYKEEHKKIFEAIHSLHRKQHPIDILTVTQELKSMGALEIVGGMFYVTNLTTKAYAASNIEYHAHILSQKYIQRQLIRISQETIQNAYNDTTDIFDLIEYNQKSIHNMVSVTHKSEPENISDLMKKSLVDLQIKPSEGLTGVGSGIRGIDDVTGGWQPSDLVIIAARPAMGKTAFVLNCARNAAVQFGVPTLMFSLEMSKIQLTNRLIASETGIPLSRILKHDLRDNEVLDIQSKIIDLENNILKIDDTAALTTVEFRAKVRRFLSKHDTGLIIVDYLQLMHGDGTKFPNRDAEIGHISRTLKAVAKDLNVPVLALSQLSRGVDSRPGTHGKRPVLSDLRESGNIEQDADLVGFLYRPDYYGITQDEAGKTTIGLTEFIMAKNRNGITPRVKMNFNGAYMKFKDWEEPEVVTIAPVPDQQGAIDFSFDNIPPGDVPF